MENIAWAELEPGAGFIRYSGCGHGHKDQRLALRCMGGFLKRLKKERPNYIFRVENGMLDTKTTGGAHAKG